jgi:hypothetical protein
MNMNEFQHPINVQFQNTTILIIFLIMASQIFFFSKNLSFSTDFNVRSIFRNVENKKKILMFSRHRHFVFYFKMAFQKIIFSMFSHRFEFTTTFWKFQGITKFRINFKMATSRKLIIFLYVSKNR